MHQLNRWMALYLMLGVVWAVCALPLAHAEGLWKFEALEDVQKDDNFERIGQHLGYGKVPTPTGVSVNAAPGAPHFRNWQRFFTGGDEAHLPTIPLLPANAQAMQGRGPRNPIEHVELRWVLRDLAPAYLACMEDATKKCNKSGFAPVQEAFRRQVIDGLDLMVTESRQAEAFYMHQYQGYNAAIRAELTTVLQKKGKDWAGVDPKTTKTLEMLTNVVSFGNAGAGLIDRMDEINLTGRAAPKTALGFASIVYDIFNAGGELLSAIHANAYAVRSLANLKLYGFYHDKVTPYLQALAGQARAQWTEADKKFGEKYCYACGDFRPGVYPSSLEAPPTSCSHAQRLQPPVKPFKIEPWFPPERGK